MPGPLLLKGPSRSKPTIIKQVSPVYSVIQVINLGVSTDANINPPDIRTATDQTSYATASWTPPTTGLIVCVTATSIAAGPVTNPTLSGNGVSWSNWITFHFQSGADWLISMWAADATNAVTGVTTVDYAGQLVRSGDISFCQVLGVDLSDGVSAATIQRRSGGVASATSQAIAMSNPADPNNRVLTGWLHSIQEVIRPPSGFTSIDNFTGAGPTRSFATSWRDDMFDTNPTASAATASLWAGIAVELKAQKMTTGIATPAGPSYINSHSAGFNGPAAPLTSVPLIRSKGQDYGLPVSGSVTINIDTPGLITWTGSAITLVTKITPTEGLITWSGSTLGLVTTVTPTPGAVTWGGSSVGLVTQLNVLPGTVTWNGQQVGLVTKITPVAGQVLWSGATDIVLTSVGNTVITVTVPGQIIWTGSQVVLVITGPPAAIVSKDEMNFINSRGIPL